MDLHPAASHHLPAFITAPGETDVLMVVMAAFLLLAVMAFGIIFLRLHSLPERIAHRSNKLQFEIVAVLCLIALFTHIHLFWLAALLLALIDLPDFGTPLGRIAGSLEKIAGTRSSEPADDKPLETAISAEREVEPAEPTRELSKDVKNADGVPLLPVDPAVAPAIGKDPVHA